MFIGYDTIQHNAVVLEATPQQIVKRFSKLFGRPVVVVGESIQEVGHIDLIVTPLRGRKVAVADSRAGARLAASAVDRQPDDVLDFETRCEQMYFGREDVTELTDRDGKKIIRPNVVGQTKAAISASLQIAPP